MIETTRMEIATSRPARQPKEIKIRLSHEMCVRLHSRKILDGVTIAETVSAALEAYFLPASAAAAPAAVEDAADE